MRHLNPLRPLSGGFAASPFFLKKIKVDAIFVNLFVYIIVERRKHCMNRDEDILEGLRKNRGEAQRLLLQRHGGMVFSQILRIVPHREDAEEVYQDVFMKVFRSIGGYDPGKASLATWLMRIAYHEALNFARGGKSRSVGFGEWTSDAELMSEAEVDAFFGRTDEETVSLVEQALDRLTPYEQSLVSMFYYQDMSAKDIAWVTDSPQSTVLSRLFRIRHKLYRIIKEDI